MRQLQTAGGTAYLSFRFYLALREGMYIWCMHQPPHIINELRRSVGACPHRARNLQRNYAFSGFYRVGQTHNSLPINKRRRHLLERDKLCLYRLMTLLAYTLQYGVAKTEELAVEWPIVEWPLVAGLISTIRYMNWL